MSIDSFKPTIWAAALQGHLDKTLVAGSLVNSDYQGDLAYGKTVTVNKVGAVTVANYDPTSTVISPDTITTTAQDLDVDQAKYFAIKLDDVDAAQARASVLGSATERGAYALRDAIDSYLLNEMADVTSPIDQEATAFETLVKLGTALTENKVPLTGRFAVVTPAFQAQLVLDSRLNRATATGDGVARTGFVGEAAGFTVMVSHNLPSGIAVLAGHDIACSYVGQVNKVEAYRDQASFSDIVRALVVFGAKVFEGDALVSAAESGS